MWQTLLQCFLHKLLNALNKSLTLLYIYIYLNSETYLMLNFLFSEQEPLLCIIDFLCA